MSKIVSKDCYLVVGCTSPEQPWRASLSVRVASREPSLKAHERAIQLKLRLPVALWLTPKIVATVEVPAEDVSAREIPAQVLDAVEQSVAGIEGVQIEIRVVEPSDEEPSDA